MNKRIEEELFPFYALGALTEAEQAEVEAYIAGDPEAKARLLALQEAAQAVPLASSPVLPAPQVKASLMARVRADSQAREGQLSPTPRQKSTRQQARPRTTWWDRLRQSIVLPALAGTAALAAVLLFIWAIGLDERVSRLQQQVSELENEAGLFQAEMETLRSENDQLAVRNQALQQQLEAQSDILAAYQQPGTRTIAISDITGENPETRATLTVAPDANSATFVAANLPSLEAGLVYQLWLIRGEQPLSAGIFEADENGRIVLQVDGSLAAAFDAVGVSIEPAGGSEQPTPDQIIMLGAASS